MQNVFGRVDVRVLACLFLAAIFFAGSADAVPTEITSVTTSIDEATQISALPVITDYDGTSQVLTYTELAGAIAQVTFDDGTITVFGSVDLTATFNLTADQTVGTTVSGLFNTGTVDIDLNGTILFTNSTADVTGIHIMANVLYYEGTENDAVANPVFGGEGIIINTSVTVDSVSGIDWGSTNGRSGVRALTSALTPANLISLNEDFDSINGNFNIVASDEGFVPEPATMILLGLGGFGLICRRKV